MLLRSEQCLLLAVLTVHYPLQLKLMQQILLQKQQKTELRYLQSLLLVVLMFHPAELMLRLIEQYLLLVVQLKLRSVLLKLLAVQLLQNLQKTVHSN